MRPGWLRPVGPAFPKQIEHEKRYAPAVAVLRIHIPFGGEMAHGFDPNEGEKSEGGSEHAKDRRCDCRSCGSGRRHGRFHVRHTVIPSEQDASREERRMEQRLLGNEPKGSVHFDFPVDRSLLSYTCGDFFRSNTTHLHQTFPRHSCRIHRVRHAVLGRMARVYDLRVAPSYAARSGASGWERFAASNVKRGARDPVESAKH